MEGSSQDKNVESNDFRWSKVFDFLVAVLVRGGVGGGNGGRTLSERFDI